MISESSGRRRPAAGQVAKMHEGRRHPQAPATLIEVAATAGKLERPCPELDHVRQSIDVREPVVLDPEPRTPERRGPRQPFDGLDVRPELEAGLEHEVSSRVRMVGVFFGRIVVLVHFDARPEVRVEPARCGAHVRGLPAEVTEALILDIHPVHDETTAEADFPVLDDEEREHEREPEIAVIQGRDGEGRLLEQS